MRQQSVKLACYCFVTGPSLFAEQLPAAPPPQLTVENINKATEVLRDPAIIAEKTGQGNDRALAVVNNAAPPDGGVIKDPTLMNQNFREALSRAIQNKTGTGVNGIPHAELSKIALLASICGGHF